MVIDGAGGASSVEPLIIDATRFARDTSKLAGELPLARLPRLGDVLFDRAGAVRYAVEGYMSALGRPALRFDLTADLALRCQRCLERLPLHLNLRREFVLVGQAEDLDCAGDEDENVDAITGAESLDLHDLVEQEIVLSLPMAPCHAEDTCRLQPAPAKLERGASPFSALAGPKAESDENPPAPATGLD
ncbi:MAG TPA: YceD family protein [Burkholderiales bacterium]|nr:YceD family protein [Burkholderiales bacterium]